MKGAYTQSWSPVARVGDVVALDDGSEQRLYEIQRLAPLPDIEMSSITVAANTVSRDNQLTNLETWDGWFAQYRMARFSEEIPDGVDIEFDLGGRQAPLFKNREQRGTLNNASLTNAIGDTNDNTTEVTDLSHLAELYVHEQESPFITIDNTTGASETIDIGFAGFQFEIQRVDEAQGQPVHVPVEALSG